MIVILGGEKREKRKSPSRLLWRGGKNPNLERGDAKKPCCIMVKKKGGIAKPVAEGRRREKEVGWISLGKGNTISVMRGGDGKKDRISFCSSTSRSSVTRRGKGEAQSSNSRCSIPMPSGEESVVGVLADREKGN